MNVLYEWNFHNRICRVVESEPGIVHFEEASRTTGDPSVMLFNWTVAPFGAANEIIQLSMALAEAHVINHDLSASIAKWQEERNRSERELEALRAEVASMVVQNKDLALIIRGWSQGHDHDQREIAALRACLREFERAIGEHSAPSDCYATGPMTGDSFRDLIQCPACSALAMYRSLMVPPIPLPEDEG